MMGMLLPVLTERSADPHASHLGAGAADLAAEARRISDWSALVRPGAVDARHPHRHHAGDDGTAGIIGAGAFSGMPSDLIRGWIPVRRQKCDQTKRTRAKPDSIKTGFAPKMMGRSSPRNSGSASLTLSIRDSRVLFDNSHADGRRPHLAVAEVTSTVMRPEARLAVIFPWFSAVDLKDAVAST